MHLTDDQLHAAIAHGGSLWRDRLLKELRFRIRRKALEALLGRKGTCGHGLRVYRDDKGAMSSGYIGHEGGGICGNGGGVDVEWDPLTPHQERMKALRDSMR